MLKTIARHITGIGLLSVMVGACSVSEPILPGERIAISSNTPDLMLQIDADAAAEGVKLPVALANKRFTSVGATPSHGGGHFAVELPLTKAFREDVGINADEGTVMAQPVANGEAVFTITPGGIVTASSAENDDLIWTLDIDPSEDETQLSVSGGIALGQRDGQDIIYVHAAKNTLFALNADNGKILWSQDFGVFLSGGPTVDSDILVIVDSEGRLYALSTFDGQIVWSRVGSLDDTQIAGASSPAINGDEIIHAGGDGEFLALSRTQGGFQWGENLSPIELRTALDSIVDINAHPVHDGGFVFVITNGGFMYAFNAVTGRIVWEQSIQGIEMPWVAGQTIYVTTIDGRIVALRKTDGAIRWVTEMPGAYDPNRPVVEDQITYTSAVVVSGKVVLASSEGKLFILDAETGRIETNLSTNGSVTTAPIVANNTVYLINRSGNLLAFR